MKKDFGSKTWIFPMPVLMIGTYDEKGVANMTNVKWKMENAKWGEE